MSELIEMLKRHEGKNLYPYADTVGKLTIGYGRNLTDNGISQDEAEYMLNNDVQSTLAALRQYPWYRMLNGARQDAITDMAYNLGMPKFLGFHDTIKALADGRWSDAKTAMLESHWANQIGARATELATMVESGVYQQ